MKPEINYVMKAVVEKVIDGDTIRCLIKHPFYVRQTRVDIRLKDINCPEMNTPAGIKAKEFVESIVHVGDDVIVQSYVDTKGQFKKTFDRFVADVWVTDLHKLQDLIVGAGHGVQV
jgi:endonuclease YncB( thermonuclease family)